MPDNRNVAATVRPLHPFPARMASEIVHDAIWDLAPGSTVMDPMCGSGTVLRAATTAGHRAIGFDIDPLAVLMASVTVSGIKGATVRRAAARLAGSARSLRSRRLRAGWIDKDPETRDFVNYWFAEPQRNALHTIAVLLRDEGGATGDALRLSLSRTIVTKDRGASLARDVSHSRPHRVRETNDFDVFDGFEVAANRIARHIEESPLAGRAHVRLGDVRALPSRYAGSVDLLVTSPPYLNAIDYLRGHRLALVWFGYRVGELREIRAGSIGAERAIKVSMADDVNVSWISRVVESALDGPNVAPRNFRIIERYAYDLVLLGRACRRALRKSGKVIVVIGDNRIKTTLVRNARIATAAFKHAGFLRVDASVRPIPDGLRYLPPPTKNGTPLDGRMRREHILHFSPEGV